MGFDLRKVLALSDRLSFFLRKFYPFLKLQVEQVEKDIEISFFSVTSDDYNIRYDLVFLIYVNDESIIVKKIDFRVPVKLSEYLYQSEFEFYVKFIYLFYLFIRIFNELSFFDFLSIFMDVSFKNVKDILVHFLETNDVEYDLEHENNYYLFGFGTVEFGDKEFIFKGNWNISYKFSYDSEVDFFQSLCLLFDMYAKRSDKTVKFFSDEDVGKFELKENEAKQANGDQSAMGGEAGGGLPPMDTGNATEEALPPLK